MAGYNGYDTAPSLNAALPLCNPSAHVFVGGMPVCRCGKSTRSPQMGEAIAAIAGAGDGPATFCATGAHIFPWGAEHCLCGQGVRNRPAYPDWSQFTGDEPAPAPEPPRARGVSLGAGSVIYEPCVLLKPEMISIGANSRIDSFVKIEGGRGVQIGRCVHIASFCHLNIGGGNLEIGDYAACASGSRVISGSNTIDGRSMSAAAPPEMQVVEYKRTRLGERATLLAGVTVLPGISIGDDAVIGAGAVVLCDVPPGEMWAGVPAKFIKRR